jgi:hypothetical protein
MKRLSQRFVLAAVAFSSAAVWQGLNLLSALECLIAFTVVYAIAGAMQNGRARLERQRGHGSRETRSRSPREARRRVERPRERSTSLPDVYDRPRKSALRSGEALFDDGRLGSSDEWASAADGAW